MHVCIHNTNIYIYRHTYIYTYIIIEHIIEERGGREDPLSLQGGRDHMLAVAR